MAVNPYGLNKRVYFGTTKTGTNPNTGGPVEEFQNQFKRWCGVTTQSMQQRFSAVNTEFENSKVIIIRHTPKVNKSLVAKIDGEVYDVIDISSDESINVQRFDYVTLSKTKKVM